MFSVTVACEFTTGMTVDMGLPFWLNTTPPVIACVAMMLAVNVTDPPCVIFALELVTVIEVGVGAPPPPPPPLEPPPPPQPNANVATQISPSVNIARYLRFRAGIPIRNRNATALANDTPHQFPRVTPNTPAFRNCGLTDAPAVDPVVDSVNVTCTGAPARLTVVGFTVRVVPGTGLPGTDSVTVLGVLLAGAMVRVALPVCPSAAEIPPDAVMVKSGMFTVTVPEDCAGA